MFEFLYSIFSAIFSPVLWMPKIVSEIVVAAFITFVTTLIAKRFVDQVAVKKIKDETKNLQNKIKEVQNTNPEQAKSLSNEMMKLANKQMSMNFKSMIPTMIFIIAILPWVVYIYGSTHVAMLPFTLPYFGNDFGWLMWYFISSIMFSMLFRKVLGVE